MNSRLCFLRVCYLFDSISAATLLACPTLFGIGESQLVTVLADLIDKQTDPTLAPYAKVGEVTLRLSTKADSQEEANVRLNQLEEEILQRDHLKIFLCIWG